MQGFNMGRYVPPDVEGTVASGNQVVGKNALGKRASQLRSEGVLVVRFAAPFAIWCDHCSSLNPKVPVVIGKGTRFNAEKRTVGAYHSTPIISFRIKHTICGQWIVIRTDPQNTDYSVVSGGRKRDYGDESQNLATKNVEEDRQRRNEDAFAALEGLVNDKKEAIDSEKRIETLRKKSHHDWKDVYSGNRKLRRKFRIERKAIERETAATEALKEKMSLGIELLPELETDRLQAKRIEFALRVNEEDEGGPDDHRGSSRKTGSLGRLLVGNTKQNANPFNVPGTRSVADAVEEGSRRSPINTLDPSRTHSLVEYDSG